MSTVNKNPEKTVDVPPRGDRNADPITNAPGSHPVETGIGAALGGAATGAAVGTVAGPIGTAVGMMAGAVAGGLAGKGVGELIDPTTEDNWLRDRFASRPYVREGETFEHYRPIYRYGAEAEAKYGHHGFDKAEREIAQDWANAKQESRREWHEVRDAVRDAYDRSCQIRKARQGSTNS